jgi:hypothetical protein
VTDRVLLTLGSTYSRREPDSRTSHLIASTSAWGAIGRGIKLQEYCQPERILILLETSVTSGWPQSRDDLPSRLKQYTERKLPCVSDLVSQRYPQRTCNSERKTVQFNIFTSLPVPDLQTNGCSGMRQKLLKCWKIPVDNVLTHTQTVLEKLSRHLAHLAHGLDTVSNDFCLFGNLK